MFGFGQDGALIDPFWSPWGTAGVIRVEPEDAPAWVGSFEAGGLGGVSGVYASPDPHRLVVASNGTVLLVDVRDPRAGAAATDRHVQQVEAVADAGLLLLVGYSEMTAIGASGLAWRTGRLGLDGLRVLHTSVDAIACEIDHPGEVGTLTLDPATGQQTSGTRFDGYWPKDALDQLCPRSLSL